ncbi:MAG: DUF1501 domain-containing protein [Planctomycetota bacterium]
MDDNLDRIISRRSFLRRGACASLGLAGLSSQLLASRTMAATLQQQSFTDYRALVCVFLFGGNDNGNTLIPLNAEQTYADYARGRDNLAIPRRYLRDTTITPSNAGGATYALHPALKHTRQLFNQGNAALVANVGTLLEPVTKQQWQRGGASLPRQLFAHDQQAQQWQLSRPDARDGQGWGGRLADLLHDAATTPDATVSMNISLAGTNQFLAGRHVVPYALGPEGPPSIGHEEMSRQGQHQLRRAYMDMLAATQDPHHPNRHAMVDAVRDVTQRALVANEQLERLLSKSSRLTPPDEETYEENELIHQLHAVARLIENAEQGLGHQRQIFFVALGGFDHHDGLVGAEYGETDEDGNTWLGPHGELLRQLDDALAYFWDALGTLNKRDAVTTFTASDFGRTFASNGKGSDHGWGAHHLVLGGSQLQGNRLVGTFPNLRVDGPDDTDEGRFIPTTAVDAYGHEFARWMGVPASEMTTVFPNLNRFLDPRNPATHLGLLT